MNSADTLATRPVDGLRPLTGRGPLVVAAVIAAVALVVVAVPALAATLVPERTEIVRAGAEEVAPIPALPVARFAPPPGWNADATPRTANDPFVYRDGDAELRVFAAPEVPDLGVYAGRQVRLAGATDGVTTVPAGEVGTAAGFAGPRFTTTAEDGRRGEMFVLGRDGAAVGVWLVSDPAHPADPRPVLDSLQPAS